MGQLSTRNVSTSRDVFQQARVENNHLEGGCHYSSSTSIADMSPMDVRPKKCWIMLTSRASLPRVPGRVGVIQSWRPSPLLVAAPLINPSPPVHADLAQETWKSYIVTVRDDTITSVICDVQHSRMLNRHSFSDLCQLTFRSLDYFKVSAWEAAIDGVFIPEEVATWSRDLYFQFDISGT